MDQSFSLREQVRLIRRTARDAAELAEAKQQVSAVRSWMILDLLLSSGLREAEAAGLRCGDLQLGYGEAAIFVASGKGKSRARFKYRLTSRRTSNDF